MNDLNKKMWPHSDETLVERMRELSAPMTPRTTDTQRKLSRLEGLRAVVFDVYGTMFISGSGDVGTAAAQDHAWALAAALRAADFTGAVDTAADEGIELLHAAIREEHEERRRMGVDVPEVEIRDIWERVLTGLAEGGVLDAAFSTERLQRLALEYECRVNPVWPMPGLAELLGRIRDKGLTLGIVSNAQFYTPLLFAAFLDGCMTDQGFAERHCVWSYQLGSAKPSSAMFERLREGLAADGGVRMEDTLYVGNDMLNDIWAASQAGCRTALFAGDARSLRQRKDDIRCAGLEPDVVVTELMDLAEVIGL